MVSGADQNERVERHRVAAEVVELGEALFDAVIDVAASCGATGEEAAGEEALSIDEARAATETFFVALRLLLGLAPATAETPADDATAGAPRVEG